MNGNNEAPTSEQAQGFQRKGIGKYRFIARIGSGGMAEVFLAVQEGPARFRKLMAVKVLRSQYAEQVEGREMFLNEARLASRLSHPNIVSVVEVGADDSDLFIAMEYLKGQSLAHVLSRARGLRATPDSEVVLLRVLSDALAGVHDAHETQDFDGTPLRLVHRDLTPQNIFVTYEGTVKVLDFGIAKALANTMETRAGMIKGKIPFLAPEQLSTETPIDRRVDIYSMGCCLWQIIAGRHPFKGMTDVETIATIASRGAPPIRSAVADVPDELERICSKATAFKPNDRYADAAEFQADLDKYIHTLGDAGTRRVGKFVSGLFAEESAKAQQVIEAALSHPFDASAQMPAFSISGPHPSAGSYVSDSQSGLGSGPSAAMLAPATPRRPLRAAAAAVAITALVAVGAVLLRSQVPHDRATAASSASAGPEAPVRLKLMAQPGSARLFLDGASVATNPADLTLPKDGARHMVRAEAAGYVERVEEVTLDGDKDVLLSLDPLPEQAASSRPAGTAAVPTRWAPTAKASAAQPTPPDPPPTAVAPTAPAPTPTAKKPQRQIDDDNPFEKK